MRCPQSSRLASVRATIVVEWVASCDPDMRARRAAPRRPGQRAQNSPASHPLVTGVLPARGQQPCNSRHADPESAVQPVRTGDFGCLRSRRTEYARQVQMLPHNGEKVAAAVAPAVAERWMVSHGCAPAETRHLPGNTLSRGATRGKAVLALDTGSHPPRANSMIDSRAPRPALLVVNGC
jgi:hypothetical protein